jgi:hypothetical protein
LFRKKKPPPEPKPKKLESPVSVHLSQKITVRYDKGHPYDFPKYLSLTIPEAEDLVKQLTEKLRVYYTVKTPPPPEPRINKPPATENRGI